MLHERSFLMAKKNVFLHFLSNYIVVLLLFFTLFVMGPSEIFFGNYKEFGFVYQEFGWKFLIFAFLISFIFKLNIKSQLSVNTIYTTTKTAKPMPYLASIFCQLSLYICSFKPSVNVTEPTFIQTVTLNTPYICAPCTE